MVAVHSTMLPLGTAAPGFTLPDGTGRIWTLDEIADGAPALVVSFLSNHCPYVKRIGEGFGRATATLAERGVAVVGIMSNDVEVTAVDLLAAVDAVLAGGTPSERQVPSMGCNIKWRPGNAPDWFA